MRLDEAETEIRRARRRRSRDKPYKTEVDQIEARRARRSRDKPYQTEMDQTEAEVDQTEAEVAQTAHGRADHAEKGYHETRFTLRRT